MTTGVKENADVLSSAPSIAEPKPDLSEHELAIDGRRLKWRVWIPVFLLIAVAVAQVVLAKTAGLSPWKGGGFGMFATNDGTAFRHVRVFVEAQGRSEELEIAPSQEFEAARAQLFPSDAMMKSLGRSIVDREHRYGRPVRTVKLEVWRTEFSAGSLESKERLLRALTLNDTTSTDNTR